MDKKWRRIKIGDLGRVVTGNTPPKKDKSNYGGPYPFIKPTDMTVGHRRCNEWEETYSEKAFQRYHRAYIPPGSTGVVTIGTVGEKLFQSNRWCFTNQSVNVVIPHQGQFDPDFVYYLMKVSLPKVENANPGTASGRHHVSKSNFESIGVDVPSYERQQKIGAVLSAYDELIENNLKRIKLLEEKAQQTYEEWFVRMRFPGHESTSIDSATGLPEGWKKQPLSELTVLVSRGSAPKYVETDGYVVVNQKCIRDGRVQLEKSRLTSKEKKIRSDRFLQFADTLINSTGTGTAGRVGLFQGTRGPVTVDTHVTIVRADQDLMKFYIYAFLHRIEDELAGMARGSTNQVELAAKDINRISVVVPSDRLLAEYQSLVGKNFELVHGLFSANAHLGEARDILLPRLMTGMIDVEELDVELPMTA